MRSFQERKYMKYTDIRYKVLLSSATILAGAMIVAGCNKPSHPDEKAAVNDSLKNSNLSAVSVSQDQDKGVMTLKGNVDSQDLKSQAENIAKQAAPDYTVANEIGVRPPGASEAGSVASNLDNAIEDNYKAMIKSHASLNDQSISADAKNGTLVLKGTVKTTKQKKEAEDLAKKVPNVQQVVNEIEVNPKKHSTATS